MTVKRIPWGGTYRLVYVRDDKPSIAHGERGYRVYAAPIDPDDPASMWQWYDETDQPFGDPVPPLTLPNALNGGTP